MSRSPDFLPFQLPIREGSKKALEQQNPRQKPRPHPYSAAEKGTRKRNYNAKRYAVEGNEGIENDDGLRQ